MSASHIHRLLDTRHPNCSKRPSRGQPVARQLRIQEANSSGRQQLREATVEGRQPLKEATVEEGNNNLADLSTGTTEAFDSHSMAPAD